jgi:undecaprenyl-diphosphatase
VLELIQQIDGNLLLWIQENLRGPLDGIVSVWTNLGEAGILWILLGLLMLAFPKTRRAGVTALVAMAVSYLVNDLVIKNLVCRPRPFLTVEGLVPLIKAPSSFSFPSGHSCVGLAAANVWWRTLEKTWMKVTLLAMAILMALSRLYVGVHYPSDVLVGCALGTLLGQLVWHMSLRVGHRPAGE